MAGAAKRAITPPAGLPMDGYGARVGAATGTHDTLWASALALERGPQRLMLVACDLIGADLGLVQMLRGELEAPWPGTTGVFVSATHTHSGPAGSRPPVDRIVIDVVREGILEAARAAREHLTPARLGAGWGRAPGVGANRRDPQTPYDPVVGVVRVDTGNGQPIAALVNFACHPTVLSPENLLYSGDYPAATVSAVERAIGQGVVALFVNGAAGDISTRFTRTASTFAEAERLGGLLAHTVLSVYAGIASKPVHHIAGATRTIDLPPCPLAPTTTIQDDLDRARQTLTALRASSAPHGHVRIAETAVQGLERQLARAREGVSRPISAELGAFALDGILGVTWPGEIFNAYAEDLRRRAGRPLLVLGYTNGLIGYVPTREAFQAGGYEATSAQVGPEAGELIVATSLELLRDVAPRA